MGVDVLGLLTCWVGGCGSDRLKSQVPTLTLRKAFSVEKDLDLFLRFPAFWRPWFQSSLSGGSVLLFVSGLMSQLMSLLRDIPRLLNSISETGPDIVGWNQWLYRGVGVLVLGILGE